MSRSDGFNPSCSPGRVVIVSHDPPKVVPLDTVATLEQYVPGDVPHMLARVGCLLGTFDTRATCPF